VRVGLTGGIASGKSTVAELLVQLGAVLIDGDALAREVVARGTPGLAQVIEEFGEELLTAEGDLDRAALGRIVFADEASRRRLEEITHPLIFKRYAELEAAAPPDAVVVHDIPLLAESGRADTFDEVIVVDVPAELQVERMMRDRGWSREDAESRIAAQATREDRLAIATYVIDNSGSLEELRARVEEVYAELSRRRATPAEVRHALEVALRDFQQPTPVELTFEVGTSGGDDLIYVAGPGGSQHGMWVDGSAEDVLVRVADFLQDQVFDQLAETWGEARPPCPGHPHPANPVLLEQEAWWVCPRTGDRLGRIGSLGS
jgi:dephospho-CoA kinase